MSSEKNNSMVTPARMDGRNTILLYTDAYFALREMDLNAVGAILLALLEYQLTGNDSQIDMHLRPVYTILRMQVDRNNQKYDDARRKKQEAGRQGGLTKARNARRREQQLAQISSATDGIVVDSEEDHNLSGNSIVYQDQADVHIPVPAPNPGPMPIPVPVSLTRESEEGAKVREFALLWDAYPRHQSLEEAKTAYLALNLPPITVLLDAIERLNCSAQWQQDNGKYIPALAKWLRCGGWQDQLPAPSVGYQRHGDPISPAMLQAAQDMLAEPD